MDTAAFEVRLNELLNEISDIPSGQGKKLLLLTQKKKPANQKLPKAGSLDVEATRRENSYLRKMLEGSGD
jgi:hypothetical protein